MQAFQIDTAYILICAVISLIMTGAIILVINTMQPGLIVVKSGTSLFIYIGVFAANLIIEASRQRLEKRTGKH